MDGVSVANAYEPASGFVALLLSEAVYCFVEDVLGSIGEEKDDFFCGCARGDRLADTIGSDDDGYCL
jgi:hypothetical protein